MLRIDELVRYACILFAMVFAFLFGSYDIPLELVLAAIGLVAALT